MKPRTAAEYLDVTRQDLKDVARLLGERGHLELSVQIGKELREAERFDGNDYVGMRARIIIARSGVVVPLQTLEMQRGRL